MPTSAPVLGARGPRTGGAPRLDSGAVSQARPCTSPRRGSCRMRAPCDQPNIRQGMVCVTLRPSQRGLGGLHHREQWGWAGEHMRASGIRLPPLRRRRGRGPFGHCHHRSLAGTKCRPRMFQRAPGGEVVDVDQTDVYVISAEGRRAVARDPRRNRAGGRPRQRGLDVLLRRRDGCPLRRCRHRRCSEVGDAGSDLGVALRLRLVSRRRARGLRGLRDGRPESQRDLLGAASDGGDLTRITSNPAGGASPAPTRPTAPDSCSSASRTTCRRACSSSTSPRPARRAGSRGRSHLPGWSSTTPGTAGRGRPTARRSCSSLGTARTTTSRSGSSTSGPTTARRTGLPIAPGCGGPLGDADVYGCYVPDCSPDGDNIVFTRSEPDGSTRASGSWGPMEAVSSSSRMAPTTFPSGAPPSTT